MGTEKSLQCHGAWRLCRSVLCLDLPSTAQPHEGQMGVLYLGAGRAVLDMLGVAVEQL